ncbi:MAG: hypothetical protein M3R24_30125 [Chloroflexota bacterium]|nr:hypothetical protein [Chloroflexota bacterium]
MRDILPRCEVSQQAALLILPALIGLDPLAGVVAVSIAAAVETALG